jgi:D-alanyl-D-alanine dipeptidase
MHAISSFAVAMLTASLAACAQSPVARQPPNAANDTAVPAPAPAQPIDGTIVNAARAYASARSDVSLCELAPAAARAQRFESGRFLVTIPAADACAAKFEKASAWIDARNLRIDDAAYALARVSEQPGLRIDMAYTGNRIFCDDRTQRCLINEALYAQSRCYVAPKVAEALANAAKAIVAQDSAMRLVVLDCYRPIYVQERMFALVANPEWVAQPKPPRYGGHNRAVAVDLTIEKNGVALDMGSPFDAFDERSNYREDGRGISPEQQRNRNTLRALMIGAGFRPYDGEWWHFSLPIETQALNMPL